MSVTDFNIVLGKAVKDLADIKEDLKVPTKGGKKYTMVQDRMRIFRNHFGLDARITTEQTYDGPFVRSITSIWVNDNLIANGISEENRNANFINKTSAAEVAETSSIGRALSNLGLMGSEYPSGDEMLQALANQDEFPESVQKKTNHNITPKGKKEQNASTGNKPSSSGSQTALNIPGWDTMNLAEQVQTFSSKLNEATHPGHIDEIVTPFVPWFKTLKKEDQEQIKSISIEHRERVKK